VWHMAHARLVSPHRRAPKTRRAPVSSVALRELLFSLARGAARAGELSTTRPRSGDGGRGAGEQAGRGTRNQPDARATPHCVVPIVYGAIHPPTVADEHLLPVHSKPKDDDGVLFGLMPRSIHNQLAAAHASDRGGATWRVHDDGEVRFRRLRAA
jgi:hypothetical protein